MRLSNFPLTSSRETFVLGTCYTVPQMCKLSELSCRRIKQYLVEVRGEPTKCRARRNLDGKKGQRGANRGAEEARGGEEIYCIPGEEFSGANNKMRRN